MTKRKEHPGIIYSDVNLEPIHQADISASVYACIEAAFVFAQGADPEAHYTRAVVVPNGIRLVREDGPTFLVGWQYLNPARG